MINGAVGSAAGAAAGGAPGTAIDAVNGMDAMSDAFTASGASGAGGFASEGMAAGLQGAVSSPVTSGGDWTSMVNDAQQSLGATEPMSSLATGGESASSVASPVGSTATTVEPVKTQSLIGESKDFVPSQAQANGYSPAADSQKAFTQMAATGSKDYFTSFLNWVRNNKEVSNGILTLGSGALKGMSERSMFDEKMAMENKKYGYGNTVANFKGFQPQPLIGAH